MRQLGAIGKAAFMGLAVGAIAVGAASVHMASNFDATMERVHTQAGASQREVDGLKDGVLRLGYATGQGPTKLADALFHVESVGYRGAAAMSVLTDAAKLATISGANLDDTTYGLTSVMQTFGAKAQDSAKWAAFFNSVVGAGDMRMEAFNKAVGTGYFSAAQTFGVSAQSAGAALAFMTDRGAHADEAATRLRMTIALIAAPSAKAATLLRDIGLKGADVKAATTSMTEALAKAHLTTVSLAADLKKPDGLYVALTHLQSALKASGLSAEAANALLSHSFGGGKSDATILAMLNNLDTLKSKYAAVGKGMGSYAESFKAASDQFQTKMHRLEAGAEALGIKFGNYLIPKIEQVVGWLMQAADWCTKHQTTVEYLAAAIGGVLAVAIGAWIILMVKAAAANIAATWEIILIIAAIALLVVGIMWLKDHWSQVWGFVVDKAHAVADSVVGAWNRVKDWTSQKWGEVVRAIQSAWNSVTAWINSAWHSVVDPIVNAWNTVKRWTVTAFDGIAAFFRQWWPLLLVIFSFPLAVLLALWNHFHEAVWKVLVTVWDKVSGFFKTAWNVIVLLAKTAWEFIYQHVGVGLIRTYNQIVNVLGEAWRFIQRVWNDVTSFTSSVWNRIYNTVAGWLTSLLGTVGRLGSSLASTISGAFNSVLSWLSGVGSWFYGVGSAIVQGIINGIGGAAGGLFGSLENLASNALSSAKSFLGINSPSKVFADVVGRAIPEGIAHGVNQHAGLASAAVSRLAGGLAGAGGASGFAVSGAGVSGGAGHTIVLNQTIEAKVDGSVLFRTQQTQALRYQKRNGTQAFTLLPSN
jgi:TP901 family phage tail tape measure protein